MSILAEDTCDVPDNAIWMVTLTDHRWHTQRGLRVGDSLARLRHLYPKAHQTAASGTSTSGPKLSSSGRR